MRESLEAMLGGSDVIVVPWRSDAEAIAVQFNQPFMGGGPFGMGMHDPSRIGIPMDCPGGHEPEPTYIINHDGKVHEMDAPVMVGPAMDVKFSAPTYHAPEPMQFNCMAPGPLMPPYEMPKCDPFCYQAPTMNPISSLASEQTDVGLPAFTFGWKSPIPEPVLPTYNPIGSRGSGFTAADVLGIGGGGIAREIPSAGGFMERYLPDSHEPFGDHMNYHHLLDFGRKKSIEVNEHLLGFDWEKGFKKR